MKFILSSDDERYAGFMQRATEAFGEEIPFVRISITPDNLPEPVPSWWMAAPDRWAIVQGILAALKQAKEAGEDCEVFQDDCVFVENFSEKYEDFMDALPDDWCMAYLGGQLLATDLYQPVVQDNVIFVKNAHRDHAWICNKSSVSALIDWIETPYWPNIHTSDWRIAYFQLKPESRVYIPKSGWLCGQGANHSILDNVDYPDRWWHYTEPDRTQELEIIREFRESKRNSANNEE